MAFPLMLQTTLSLEDLRLLIDKYPFSILVFDHEGRVVLGNEEICDCLGYESTELVQMNVFDIAPDIVKKKLEEVLQPPVEAAPMYSLRTKQGLWVNSVGWISVFSSDNLSGIHYMLSLRDLRSREPTNLLQQFSGTFMRDVNLGVLLISLDFKLIDISDMACKVLDVRRDEIINCPVDEVFASVPLDHQLVQRTILDGLTVRNHALSWTNNQERYELLMDSNLLKDDKGRTVGAYVIFKDVTNLRSLEEQVQRSDRLAMIGQIAAGTAHEIRNPLTSIKGFMQVLKKTLHEKGMDKEFEYTEIMLKEIDRINELVSEFLLLGKPKNSTYRKVNVSDVFRDILPIINNEAILHNVVVEYEPAAELPEVIADRELLKQVCLNICKNGIEAMTEGGMLTITEKPDDLEQRVNIDIRDTGPGIPAFLIDKIFDPFFTTKENGTGLGLSICQRIIHDIGGIIRVSTKGFGTTFTISIPYAKT